jgi:hypothetical protein
MADSGLLTSTIVKRLTVLEVKRTSGGWQPTDSSNYMHWPECLTKISVFQQEDAVSYGKIQPGFSSRNQ